MSHLIVSRRCIRSSVRWYRATLPFLTRYHTMSSSSLSRDIEDLHKTAVLEDSTTYTDPDTGFLVFSELAHLKRGTCCGNQCRHCPYGWVNVRSGKRRPALVESGNQEAIQAHLQELKIKQKEYKNSKPKEVIPPEDTTKTKKTGGRFGGRLTEKNVPYTRGGDTGVTQLLTGERRSKTDVAFEAMGTVDELCSVVGVAHAELGRKGNGKLDDLSEQLLDIMSRLFDIGSHVAKPRRKPSSGDSDSDSEESEEATKFVADGIGGGFDQAHIEQLEDWIDDMTEVLPELTSFILPTGSPAAAQLHVARTVCRRAERRVLPLVVEQKVCDPRALQYLNRLSDFFFTAARYANAQIEMEEFQYQRPTRSSKQRSRVAVSLTEDDDQTTK